MSQAFPFPAGRISIALGQRTVRIERLQRLIGLAEEDWWIGRD